MAPVLPYTSKDTKYDNAKFRRRSALKVNPNPGAICYCICKHRSSLCSIFLLVCLVFRARTRKSVSGSNGMKLCRSRTF